jgi:[ribosomal protein S5]-alanine N-acetyltransferase
MSDALRPHLFGLPVLETQRLILRAPQAGDWPAFREYRASPRSAYAGGVKKEHEAAQQFAAFFGHWVMRGFGRLIAEDRASGVPIGHFGPMQWADADDVELTWTLWRAEAEGKGLAFEAAREVKSWCFGALGLTHAVAMVHRDNAPSHAIARKLGGVVIEGRKPECLDAGSAYAFSGAAE